MKNEEKMPILPGLSKLSADCTINTEEQDFFDIGNHRPNIQFANDISYSDNLNSNFGKFRNLLRR